MGCFICINEKTVLKCSIGVFDTLYYSFVDIIKQENIQDDQIEDLLNEMNFLNSSKCMYSLDINEHIKTSNSMFILIELLEKTIKKVKHKLKDWALADLWKFHSELVEYKAELETQGK